MFMTLGGGWGGTIGGAWICGAKLCFQVAMTILPIYVMYSICTVFALMVFDDDDVEFLCWG